MSAHTWRFDSCSALSVSTLPTDLFLGVSLWVNASWSMLTVFRRGGGWTSETLCVCVCAHVSVQVGRLRVIRGAWHWCEIWCRCQRLCIVAWRRASAYHPVLSRFWLSWHCNTGRCAGKCVDRNQFLDLFFSPHGRAPRCPRITQNDATERKSKGKKLLRLPGEVTFFPVNVKELQVPRSHTSKIQREGARPGVIVLQWLNL